MYLFPKVIYFFLRNFKVIVSIMYELNEHKNMQFLYRKKRMELGFTQFFYNNLSFYCIHITAHGKKNGSF